jgi:hypothetical protein
VARYPNPSNIKLNIPDFAIFKFTLIILLATKELAVAS